MKKLNILLLVIMLQSFVTYSSERGDSTGCNSSCCQQQTLAPAGIMTDHVHEKGKFGIAYSFMNMTMSGNQSGTNSVSNNQIFTNYLVAPAKMSMQMHMLMPMYGITDRLTAMAMINYNISNMSMDVLPGVNQADLPACCRTTVSNNNISSTMKSSGLGDTKLYLLYNLLGSCSQRLVAGAGLSLPTGNIAAKGPDKQGENTILPYSMQLGNGTYNLLPSLVYVTQLNKFTVGAAIQGNIKMGINSRNYCLGNEYSFSPWMAYKISSWANISLRGETYYAGKIYGYDAAINQTAGNDPSANVNNYGSKKMINAYAGINLTAPKSFLQEIHLLVEYGMPVYQNSEGLQSTVKSTVTARVQYNF